MTLLPHEACPFCDVDRDKVFYEGERVIGLWDAFPVSEGHALLITRRHVASWFGATKEEQEELLYALAIARDTIARQHTPEGFNIGVNDGATAGQTIPHLHVHLIPRYPGDVANPRGGVRHVIPRLADYTASVAVRTRPGASRIPESSLTTGAEDPLLPHLLNELDRAEWADIAVAFTMRSGVDRLYEHFSDLLGRGGRLRILTGDYLDATDPLALSRLLDLEGDVELRVFECHRAERSFHPKAYLFGYPDGSEAAYIGSSNLTRPALETGVEWNYRVVSSADSAGIQKVRRAFDELYSSPATCPVTPAWIRSYSNRRGSPSEVRPADIEVPKPEAPPEPHEIQKEALEALQATRAAGNSAGLVVLATGLGKTWLSAFDSHRAGFDRVLFVAHREEILAQAKKTYRRIRPSAILGHYTGAEKFPDADIVFASIQTLGKRRHLDQFDPAAFDYVVVDEFHHAAARTYRQLIDHFDPKFLLGLTATPDRTDGADLLALCQENLVYQCDLLDGIQLGLLSPFHYFGVPDEVDYANIPWRSSRFDEEALTNAVATQARAQNALDQFRERGGSRTLAFCCSKRHSDFMKEYFVDRDVRAASVHSGESSDPRATSLERLDAGELDVVFAVDMFNEGVDLPNVDTVMMLRPTESSILWTQQFGRGLRRAEGKDHLRVIDYIGNHRSFLVKPRTLLQLGSGDGQIAQALRAVQEGDHPLPPGCEVTYDLEAIDILTQLLRRPKGAETVRAFYEDFKLRHGTRPTAVEVFHAGYNPTAVSKQYGSWFGFVKAQGDLGDADALLQGSAGDFVRSLEATPMTRSYKMVTLLSMLNRDRFPGSIDIETLTAAFIKIAGRTAVLDEAEGPLSANRDDVRALIERNPVDAWVQGKGTEGTSFFDYENGVFRSLMEVPEDLRSDYQEMVRELADWRFARYLSRLREQKTESQRITGKVSHTRGRPIIFLPDREAVDQIPYGWTSVVADDRAYEANFAKIAVNVVREPDGDGNQLPALLRTWFGPDAGQPGTQFRVAFEARGDGSYSMLPIGVQADGELELWRRYTREQIPGLFGFEFNTGHWRQGFILKPPHMFLLVTLEKAALNPDHRYDDRFLSATEFQWQSQNRTTQTSGHGQAIENHEDQGIAVHLFVRPKSKEAGSRAAPFFYCGELEFERWEGEKPITVWWGLKTPVPEAYREVLRVPGNRPID